MNRSNLMKMAAFVATIPPALFSMDVYRSDDSDDQECNSIGCAIGHSTFLDPEGIKKFYFDDGIDFTRWSLEFTGLKAPGWPLSTEWHWCFSDDWKEVDDSPVGAAKRIVYLITRGVPGGFVNPVDCSKRFLELYSEMEIPSLAPECQRLWFHPDHTK